MFSRRDLFGIAAGLTSACGLSAQVAQQPVRPRKFEMVVLNVAVTDRTTRYINGLKPSDFRVLEDGILQKIHVFAEGANPPLLVNDDGATRPLVDAKAIAESGINLNAFQSVRVLQDSSYTIAYYPDSSNTNKGFRKINIEIVPDVNKNWRVRSMPGYRPKG